MFRTSFIIIILFPICLHAQVKEGAELELIHKAAVSLCSNDTLRTIELMESYISEYGGPESDLGPYNTLGNIYYFGLHDTINAVRVWKLGLDAGRSNYFNSFIHKCGLSKLAYQRANKADICVELARHFTHIGEYDEALAYLQLADTDHLPTYGGCANGMIMYRTMLTLHFATTFLAKGDTTHAMQRLVEYFLSWESYSDDVTLLLRDVLLKYHTQSQINDEVRQAIKTLTIVKRPNSDTEQARFTLFGHSTTTYSSGTIRQARRSIREHPNIRLLQGL